MQAFNCPDGIAQCAAIVKKGGVIIFPTDTVYGIGCDPFDDAAVGRIFSIKGRSEDKPLPVLVSDISAAAELVDPGKTGRLLASRFWPGWSHRSSTGGYPAGSPPAWAALQCVCRQTSVSSRF